MTPKFRIAESRDVPDLLELMQALAEAEYRPVPKRPPTREQREKELQRLLCSKQMLVGHWHRRAVASMRIDTKKPWAIDLRYFTPVDRAVYFRDVIVLPEFQRRGIGRALIAHANEIARRWPADAIRLDAYDRPSGAGPFWAKCGFRETGRALYRGTPHLYYELLLAGGKEEG